MRATQPITGTILVADDQSANRELLEELLTTQGFKVIGVSDGAVALEELTRVQADLVILDIMMPRMNGFHESRFEASALLIQPYLYNPTYPLAFPRVSPARGYQVSGTCVDVNR